MTVIGPINPKRHPTGWRWRAVVEHRNGRRRGLIARRIPHPTTERVHPIAISRVRQIHRGAAQIHPHGAGCRREHLVEALRTARFLTTPAERERPILSAPIGRARARMTVIGPINPKRHPTG